jgi:hypothetical protein
MKTKATFFLSLAALVMLLPVVSAVNIHSVNTQPQFADGGAAPPPPFPPMAHG